MSSGTHTIDGVVRMGVFGPALSSIRLSTNSRGRVSIPTRFDLTVSVCSSVTMLKSRLAYQ